MIKSSALAAFQHCRSKPLEGEILKTFEQDVVSTALCAALGCISLQIRCRSWFDTSAAFTPDFYLFVSQIIMFLPHLSPLHPHLPTSGLVLPLEVSRKLVVSLRDTDSLPAGVVRAYVSELYQDVYDAACAAHRPDLDVRVLLPQSATTPTTPTGRYSTGRSASSPSAVGADVVNSAVWATRDAIQLEPDLEVVLSDEPGVNKSCQAALNVDRIRSGLPAIVVVSLESVARKAYNTDYFYAEDVLSEIPTFSSVSAAMFSIFFVVVRSKRALLLFSSRTPSVKAMQCCPFFIFRFQCCSASSKGVLLIFCTIRIRSIFFACFVFVFFITMKRQRQTLAVCAR